MTDVIIVKVPLRDSERQQHVRKFKKMPILYLELIENKLKVRSDVINKMYEPPPTTTVTEDSTASNTFANFDYNDSSNFTPVLAAGEAQAHDNTATTTATTPAHNEAVYTLNAASDVVASTPEGGGGTSTRDLERHPPTLAQLQAKNPKHPILKREHRYAQEEDEELIKERNEVFFHYEVLKRMHPNAQIPEFTMYSDPKIMAQKYELLTKKLSLDSNVENWKRYMIIFVMGCEVVLGKMNFDMEGFAQQQIMSMNTYDSLLVEMAEKSYVPSGSKWPVELRLFSMVLMNVALFVVSKIIMKRTGTNLLSHINVMTNAGGSGGHIGGNGGNGASTSGEKVMKPPSSSAPVI